MKKSDLLERIYKTTGQRAVYFEDMLKESAKRPGFMEAFEAERNRLTLAHQLAVVRKEKRMTQATLAKKAKMAQSVIARLESGKHDASITTLERVASAMGKRIQLV